MSMALASESSSSATVDDDFEDACSICLEPFNVDDPSTATICKHDYHLHCILEWSQRSKECPICWQSLALQDPASQQLLATVGIERNARRKHVSTNGPIYSEHGSHWNGDPDFNESIMRHLAAMMTQSRHPHSNEGPRSSERSRSPVLMFGSRLSESSMHPNSPEECTSVNGSSGGSSPTSSISFIEVHGPLSSSPSLVNLPSSSSPKREVNFGSGSLQSQSPDYTQTPRSSELLAFSESIKSRLSAASSRYKDSISKSTQGLREKFLARNNSVKELSKGVQREMSASVAGVARMIERLDLKSKRNSNSGEASNFFSKP